MLSNNNEFLPTEGYAFFSILSIIVIIFYFFRISKDLSFVKVNNVKVISTPFYISFIISILSLILLFLPFVHIPFIGGISIIDMASRSSTNWDFIFPLIFIHLLFVVLSGIVAFKKISFKGAKSENIDLLFSFLVITIDLLVFIELYLKIHTDSANDNILVSAISQGFRIGAGMYLLLFFSIIQLILAFMSNKFSGKSIITPILKSESLNIDNLRELKKLFDEGVITQEEFDTQKRKII